MVRKGGLAIMLGERWDAWEAGEREAEFCPYCGYEFEGMLGAVDVCPHCNAIVEEE